MRSRAAVVVAVGLLLVTASARADEPPAEPARVWDSSQTTGGLALFATSYGYAASMGVVSYRHARPSTLFPAGEGVTPVGEMAIPLAGPYVAFFRRDTPVDRDTLLSARFMQSGPRNGIGHSLGALLYLPELGVLFGAQPIGLGIAALGLARTKPAPSSTEVPAPTLTLSPTKLPKGAGFALSFTLW